MSNEPRAAFAGQIAEVPVVELLHTILQGRHSGIARFETPVGAATLWFRDGDLVDADMGRHHMEAAVTRLLALDSGTFEVEFKPISRRQVIKASTAELIASASGRAATPQAVPNDDTDVSRRRSRRQPVSWHPTAGGKGRRLEGDVSGPVPVVSPPSGAQAVVTPASATVSGAQPVVTPTAATVSGAQPVVTPSAAGAQPLMSTAAAAAVASAPVAAPTITAPTSANPQHTQVAAPVEPIRDAPSAAVPVFVAPSASRPIGTPIAAPLPGATVPAPPRTSPATVPAPPRAAPTSAATVPAPPRPSVAPASAATAAATSPAADLDSALTVVAPAPSSPSPATSPRGTLLQPVVAPPPVAAHGETVATAMPSPVVS
ncbi:MAG: DUF4388 domain-containing protein, partial [Nannocystaceae bacterium]|nr:DUF4388 domain-containing protein [Nannocystaceae bacterium]